MTIRRMDSETPVSLDFSESVTSNSNNGIFLAEDVNKEFKNRCALEHAEYFLD